MKKHLFLLFITLFAIANSVKSANSISLGSITTESGATVTLPVSISHDFVATGFQFSLTLPAGVTIDCAEEDWETTDRTKKFTVSGNLDKGVYKFSVLSLNGKTITGNSGPVLNINLNVSATMADGTYQMKISDAILFADGTTEEYHVANATAQLVVKNGTPNPPIDDDWEDMTTSIENPYFLSGISGWDMIRAAATGSCTSHKSLEFWNTPFSICQRVRNLPLGHYRLSAQAFYRAGGSASAYASHKNGTEKINALLFAGNTSTPVPSIYDHVSKDLDGDVFITDEGEYPNSLLTGETAFYEENAYNVSLEFDYLGGDLEFGIKKNVHVTDDWCQLTNFRLEYKTDSEPNVTSMSSVNMVMRLLPGSRELARITTAPASLDPTAITWISFEPEIATVADDGTVTAVAPGVCWIGAFYDEAFDLIIVEVIDEADMTFEDITATTLINPTMDSMAGWTAKKYTNNYFHSLQSTYGASEGWNCRFDFYQTKDLEEGYYRVSCQGFFRPMNSAQNALNLYDAPMPHAVLYAGENQCPLLHIASEQIPKKLGQGRYVYVADYSGGNASTFYLPDDMQSASECFKEGLYADNSILVYWPGGPMNIGIKCENEYLGSWAIWDNFKIEAATRKVYWEDKTDLLKNPSFDDNTAVGWSLDYGYKMDVQYTALESYNGIFHYYQTIKNLPAGKYRFSAQAFYRDGSIDKAVDAINSDNQQLTAFIYAGDAKKTLPSIFDWMRDEYVDSDIILSLSDGTQMYIPNSMYGASVSFAQGHYPVSVEVEHNGGDLTVGVRNDYSIEGDWAIMDNFRLERYTGDDDDAIYAPQANNGVAIFYTNNSLYTTSKASIAVYDMSGQLVASEEDVNSMSVNTLCPGVYIAKATCNGITGSVKFRK